MFCENHLFVTLIVKVAGNFSGKFWKIGEKLALELGWGWEICYKLNINIHKGLYSHLNGQVYNINYNAHIERTRFWCAWRCLATENWE